MLISYDCCCMVRAYHFRTRRVQDILEDMWIGKDGHLKEAVLLQGVR